MSYYDNPQSSNIFNPNDFNTIGDPIIFHEHDEHDNIDHDMYIIKNGNEITTINNKINTNINNISNNLNNITNNEINIANNTAKLANITVNNNDTIINTLQTDIITLTHVNGNQTFDSNDKLQLLSNTGNIASNTSEITLLNNTVSNHEDKNITHTNNNENNIININTLSKSVQIDSLYIFNCAKKCNNLINRSSIIENDIINLKSDVINNNNEIQQTNSNLSNVTVTLNNNIAKSLENEQKINQNIININDLMPVGTILITARSPTLPPTTGYLYCNGDSISISIYADLFAILANTYKYNKIQINGYFYLPDMRQLFVRGSQQNETYPVNAQPVAMGTYQGQSIQMHSHTYSKSNSESVQDGGYSSKTVGSNIHSDHNTINMFDSSNNQINLASAETRPESISMNYMIKF